MQYFRLGQTTSAISQYAKAEKALTLYFGQSNIGAGILQHNLARISEEKGELSTAIDHFEAARKIKMEVLQTDSHPLVAISTLHEGVALSEMRRKDGMHLISEAEAALLSFLGNTHVTYAKALEAHGHALVMNGKAASAVPMLEHAYGVITDKLGREHPRVGKTLLRLASAESNTPSRRQQALLHAEEAHRLLEGAASSQSATVKELLTECQSLRSVIEADDGEGRGREKGKGKGKGKGEDRREGGKGKAGGKTKARRNKQKGEGEGSVIVQKEEGAAPKLKRRNTPKWLLDHRRDMSNASAAAGGSGVKAQSKSGEGERAASTSSFLSDLPPFEPTAKGKKRERGGGGGGGSTTPYQHSPRSHHTPSSMSKASHFLPEAPTGSQTGTPNRSRRDASQRELRRAGLPSPSLLPSGVPSRLRPVLASLALAVARDKKAVPGHA